MEQQNEKSGDLSSTNSIGAFFYSMPHEQRVMVADRLVRLKKLYNYGVGYPQPHYLCLDNSLLAPLRERSSTDDESRYAALSIFCHFIKHYTDYDVKFAVTPVMLYEWMRRRTFRDDAPYQNAWNELVKKLESFDIQVRAIEMGDASEARRHIADVEHDSRLLRAEIQTIGVREWKVCLRQGEAIIPPYYAAACLAPAIETRYFPPDLTHRLLASIIQDRITKEPGNDPKAITLIDVKASKLAKVVKQSSGKLKGVGDLGHLLVCDLGYRFFDSSQITAICLCVDDKLEDALRSHAGFSISEHFEPTNDPSTRAAQTERMIANMDRADQLASSQEAFSSQWKRFVDEVFAVSRDLIHEKLNTEDY